MKIEFKGLYVGSPFEIKTGKFVCLIKKTSYPQDESYCAFFGQTKYEVKQKAEVFLRSIECIEALRKAKAVLNSAGICPPYNEIIDKYMLNIDAALESLGDLEIL